eukprot:3007566-Rhodomonas_salina.4
MCYAATGFYATSGTDVACAATGYCAVSSTDTGLCCYQYAVLPAYEIAMRCPVLTQYMVLRPDYAMSGTGMSYGIAALLCVPCDAWYQHSVCCCPRACDAISSTDSAYGSTRVRFDTKPDSAFDASYEYAMQCLEVRQCMSLRWPGLIAMDLDNADAGVDAACCGGCDACCCCDGDVAGVGDAGVGGDDDDVDDDDKDQDDDKDEMKQGEEGADAYDG